MSLNYYTDSDINHKPKVQKHRIEGHEKSRFDFRHNPNPPYPIAKGGYQNHCALASCFAMRNRIISSAC